MTRRSTLALGIVPTVAGSAPSGGGNPEPVPVTITAADIVAFTAEAGRR